MHREEIVTMRSNVLVRLSRRKCNRRVHERQLCVRLFVGYHVDVQEISCSSLVSGGSGVNR